jgi:diguanylate cyclase (GGDEF)-like protein
MAATARLVKGETDSTTVTTRVMRGDGTWQWTETTSRPIGRFEPGQPGDRVLVMRDVTERKAMEEQLRAMAMKDGLTGLANRRAFDEALDREWRRTVREKSQMSVVMIDIDFFKPFNDAYGHQVGDDCLRAVGAALLAIALRPGDLVARYGGEELAIILAHADAQGAAVVAERARSAVEALKIPHEGTTLPVGVVTASVGVATALAVDGGSADLPSALVIAADRALYGAKKDGRNLVATGLILARPH